LQEGRENANIDAGLGFIWRASVFNGNSFDLPVLGYQAMVHPPPVYLVVLQQNWCGVKDLLSGISASQVVLFRR
jgi:hypothetical protein